MPEITDTDAPVAFSIMLSSTHPVVSTFRHYDFFLGGGWSATGETLGEYARRRRVPG